MVATWRRCVHYVGAQAGRSGHLEEPASSVELLQVGPVEAGGLVRLPVGKDLGHVCGPLQGAVSHQEGHAVHAEEEEGEELHTARHTEGIYWSDCNSTRDKVSSASC